MLKKSKFFVIIKTLMIKTLFSPSFMKYKISLRMYIVILVVLCACFLTGCGNSTKVKVTNNTGMNMQAIVYYPSGADEKRVSVDIKNGDSYEIKVNRNEEYTIFLINSMGLRFGRTDYFFDKSTANISISAENIYIEGVKNTLIDKGSQIIDYGVEIGGELLNKFMGIIDNYNNSNKNDN